MMNQVQYDFKFNSMFFCWKKHFCPKCISQKLKISYTTVEVIRLDKANINEFKLGKYYWLSGGWMVINKSNKIKIMVSIIITTVSSGSNTFVYDLNGVK